MTRRARAEAMLGRYGEETACGGKTFRAIIRPVSFDSGTKPRYAYFGPAAHKPAAGETVTSGGESYAVKRCETVLISGEELYVRALLEKASSSPETAAAVFERGGKIFARAAGFSAEAVQNAEAMLPWGEGTPAEIAEGNVVWKLTLTGVRPESGADLFATDDFRVKTGGGDFIYTGCRWTGVKCADCAAADRVYEMTALAVRREAAQNG